MGKNYKTKFTNHENDHFIYERIPYRSWLKMLKQLYNSWKLSIPLMKIKSFMTKNDETKFINHENF